MDVTPFSAIQTFLVGTVFGLALAAPPGPMNAVIAEESVLRGWLAGFTAGLGAMSADFVFFLLSLVGVVAVLENAESVKAGMVAVGGLLMLYFAYGAVRDARETFVGDADGDSGEGSAGATSGEGSAGATSGEGSAGATSGEGSADVTSAGGSAADAPGPGESRGFRKAFVLALTNPYQILFWLTVGVGLLEPGTLDVLSYLPAVGDALAGVLVVRTGSPALLGGLFGGIVVWIVGFPATLVRAGRRIDAFAPVVAGLSAVVLAGFGVVFLWDAVQMGGRLVVETLRSVV